MADKGFEVTVDDREIQKMVGGFLKKIEHPKPLLSNIGRYLRANTMKMFRGSRPDTGGVRGMRWPKLVQSTLDSKRAAVRRGKAISTRPLVLTGKLRDSLARRGSIKTLRKGVEYGTELKSKKGFPYPAMHNIGDANLPKREWLFVTREELNQIAITTRDFLLGIKRKLK